MKEFFGVPEMDLLRQSVRVDDPDAALTEAESIIIQGQVSWPDLYDRADFHCIRPQLGSLLRKMPRGIVPEEVLSRLEEANRQNLFQQLQNTGEFFAIKERLERAGITMVPFKGFWLAHDVYGNIGDRESSDLDLYIDVNDIEAIKPLMTDMGFRVQESLTGLREEYIFKELAEYNFNRWTDDGVRLSHIEFHWRMGLRPYGMNIRMADLRSQAVAASIQGREFLALTPEANLLLAVMHHGGKDRYIRLKNILDIARLVHKYENLDWPWILDTARRFSVEKLVFLGVFMASLLTGIEIPSKISHKTKSGDIRRIARNRFRRMALPVNKWYTYSDELLGWIFKIRSRDGLKIKLQLGYYTLRKIVIPGMVPLRWRHYFFNKSILTVPDNKVL